MAYFYGEMPQVWEGFFCVTSVCDRPVALGGKAEFEFGDSSLGTLKLSLMSLSRLLRIEGSKLPCSELASSTQPHLK